MFLRVASSGRNEAQKASPIMKAQLLRVRRTIAQRISPGSTVHRAIVVTAQAIVE